MKGVMWNSAWTEKSGASPPRLCTMSVPASAAMATGASARGL